LALKPVINKTDETIVELSRLNGLSDGVYAIALTLLAFDIRLPEGVLAGNLSIKLIELAPKILVYLISFIVIGGAWGSHQRMLSQIKRGDGLLVWLNLLSLLFVTLLPASSGLLGRFPGEFIAIVLFAADVILIQLSALWLWRHASKNGLINTALDPRVVFGVGRRLSLSAAAFGLTLVLAWLNATIAYIVWIGLFVILFTTDWLSWQQALKATQIAIPLDGAARGHIEIAHGADYSNILADAPDNVLVQGTFGGGLDTQVTREGDLLKTQLDVTRKQGLGFTSRRYPWTWGPANALDWNLSVNPHIPLTLHIVTGMGLADFNFTEAHLSNLRLETSMSSINLSLPSNAGQTAVHVEASTAFLVIQVPAGVAARIHSEKGMSDIEVDLKRFALVENGGEYRSSDYDTAANRVEIQLELAGSTAKII